MNKEFVDYKTALALKELGFDEPCYKYVYLGDTGINVDHYLEVEPSKAKNYNEDNLCISQPTYSAVFRWFREKHNLVAEIQAPDGKDGVWNPTIHKVYGFGNYYDYNNGFKTYEEAEQACLTKLIQIIKKDAHI